MSAPAHRRPGRRQPARQRPAAAGVAQRGAGKCRQRLVVERHPGGPRRREPGGLLSVASLKGAAYRVGDQNGNPVKQLRVTFHRKDLAALRFESGDGLVASADETVSWERRDFLAPGFYAGSIAESRSLYQSLAQLLEIGPGICLLFLLAVAAVILGRRELNAVQMVTLAAGYALYFPLILYLSAHLSFPLAVVIAAVVPGALLLNYARWLLGTRTGLLGGLLSWRFTGRFPPWRPLPAGIAAWFCSAWAW